jgi:hypothetical protein
MRLGAESFYGLCLGFAHKGNIAMDKTTEIEAAVFRRLLKHLDNNKDVQNIDLMILANFCRNCLAKWYVSAAEEQGEAIDYEAARERVYGMPYSEWKAHHQEEATPEQLAAFEARNNKG